MQKKQGVENDLWREVNNGRSTGQRERECMRQTDREKERENGGVR